MRLAQLLSAGKLVLSEASYARDAAEYTHMVTFAPDARALAAEYRALVAGGNDWQAAARASARRFRERFQPVDIFRRAGVYARFGLTVQVS